MGLPGAGGGVERIELNVLSPPTDDLAGLFLFCVEGLLFPPANSVTLLLDLSDEVVDFSNGDVVSLVAGVRVLVVVVDIESPNVFSRLPSSPPNEPSWLVI